jgi:hypothetical protein
VSGRGDGRTSEAPAFAGTTGLIEGRTVPFIRFVILNLFQDPFFPTTDRFCGEMYLEKISV